MSGLVLKLAPNERILINGAVIENGDRRARIAVKTADVHILRLRDAIHPDEATTPVSRVCYETQLILTGDRPAREGKKIVLTGIEQLASVFDDRDSRKLLAAATTGVVEGNYYRALRALRDLLPREARLIAVRS